MTATNGQHAPAQPTKPLGYQGPPRADDPSVAGAVHRDYLCDPAPYTGDPKKRPPSILILTKDEDCNIEECIETLTFSDDIVVLDSFSSDRTIELAKKFPNVRVIQRKFDTWSKHSNWALDHIQFKHPWVYYSDADERLTQDLRDEIVRRINDPAEPHTAYRLKYKNMFLGRWLRRGGLYPVWIIRLYRPDKIRYEDRQVNAHPVVEGSLGDLDEDFIHFSFNKGLLPWFHKHNSYSTMECREAVRVRTGGVWTKAKDALFNKERGARRRALKNLSFHLPMRAFLRFFYMYFLKLAILDGRAGWHYSLMISMYEYWIEVKLREAGNNWKVATERMVRKMLARDLPPGVPAPPDPGPLTDENGDPLIEVMIPTFNEAAHIAETVKNASQLGPVFVLDSFSKDGTQDLARKAGATVVEHVFENYSKQKNWGLDNLPFKGKWLFILDADERLTPELVDEIRRVARDPKSADAYFVNRVVIMMGRAVWHGGMFPSWNLRFFRRGTCRYEDRSVHEHMVFEGRPDYMYNLMLHIRRETIHDYLAKHIRYADMESDEWVKQRLGEAMPARPSNMFKDLLRWRIYLRRDVWPNIPFKPLVRFIYMYFFRLGFLDGSAGWHLANLMASYEYMIKLTYIEKLDRRRKKAGPGPGRAAPAQQPAAPARV